MLDRVSLPARLCACVRMCICLSVCAVCRARVGVFTLPRLLTRCNVVASKCLNEDLMKWITIRYES